jgi:hypothetical protein
MATLKDLVISAIEQLMIKGKKEFTSEEFYQELVKLDPTKKRASALAMLSQLVKGHKNNVYPSQILVKTGKGRYKVVPDRGG